MRENQVRTFNYRVVYVIHSVLIKMSALSVLVGLWRYEVFLEDE